MAGLQSSLWGISKVIVGGLEFFKQVVALGWINRQIIQLIAITIVIYDLLWLHFYVLDSTVITIVRIIFVWIDGQVLAVFLQLVDLFVGNQAPEC